MTTTSTQYVPLLAKVQPNRTDPTKVVAFVDSTLCFFENPIPETLKPGDMVEVMVTRAICPRHPKGHRLAGQFDFTKLKALMITPVDLDRHVLISIDGFERTEPRGRVTAQGYTDGSTAMMWLTPGRTDIVFADNGYINLKEEDILPRKPTHVWVEREMLQETEGAGVRVLGLTKLEDGQWYHLTGSFRRAQNRLNRDLVTGEVSLTLAISGCEITLSDPVTPVDPQPILEALPDYNIGDVIEDTYRRSERSDAILASGSVGVVVLGAPSINTDAHRHCHDIVAPLIVHHEPVSKDDDLMTPTVFEFEDHSPDVIGETHLVDLHISGRHTETKEEAQARSKALMDRVNEMRGEVKPGTLGNLLLDALNAKNKK